MHRETDNSAVAFSLASFNDLLERLVASKVIAALALTGSRATCQEDAVSDYDLLVVVRRSLGGVDRILTSIGASLVDLMILEAELVERLANRQRGVSVRAPEFPICMMIKRCRIIYDADGQLARLRDKLTRSSAWVLRPSFAEIYRVWFRAKFAVEHARRMQAGEGEARYIAINILMASRLGELYGAYFDVRGLPYEGTGHAIRHWKRSDPSFFSEIKRFFEVEDIQGKVTSFQAMFDMTFRPLNLKLTDPTITLSFGKAIIGMRELQEATAELRQLLLGAQTPSAQVTADNICETSNRSHEN